MRILLLSDTYSEHTEKWALGLAANGIEVGLFSFNKASYPWYENIINITLVYEAEIKLDADNIINKLSYFKFVKLLKTAIKKFNPDVLHAHYATSYGLIGALSGFHPFVISAWGTDVMRFPQKNFVNKFILQYNLKQADSICATSNTIREYLIPVTNKDIYVIPFGVDINLFRPGDKKAARKALGINETDNVIAFRDPGYKFDKFKGMISISEVNIDIWHYRLDSLTIALTSSISNF